MNIIGKLHERSTWTGLGKVVLSGLFLYAAPSCGAPAQDFMAMPVGDLLKMVGVPEAAGVLGLLLGGYDIARKEAPNVAR